MNFGQAEEHGHGSGPPFLSDEESWNKGSPLKGRQKKEPSVSVSFPTKYPNGHP